MKNGIAIAGNLIVDYIKYIESYPAVQTLTTITGSSHSTGGLACNCTLTLARLDGLLPVKVIGLVGEDEAGEFIRLFTPSGGNGKSDAVQDRPWGLLAPKPLASARALDPGG